MTLQSNTLYIIIILTFVLFCYRQFFQNKNKRKKKRRRIRGNGTTQLIKLGTIRDGLH